ncbi:MAG: hypothetical protein ACOX7F_05355 [Eubacteriales bacterium]|jgi:hypothetical protein
MTSRILQRLMNQRGDIWRGEKRVENGVQFVEYQLLQSGVPCRVSQIGTGRTILKKPQGEELSEIEQELKGFFPWDADVQSGDRLVVTLNKTQHILEVGEVFVYQNSHRECRLSRLQTV